MNKGKLQVSALSRKVAEPDINAGLNEGRTDAASNSNSLEAARTRTTNLQAAVWSKSAPTLNPINLTPVALESKT